MTVLKLRFLGGAGTVTGSKYLLENGKSRILVDCGLFQGYKVLRVRNWAAPPVPPAAITATVLTHAHLDHSGHLPLLVKKGFKGPVFCSQATAALCGILLPDSGHLQEQDADFANRHQFSRHHPALPLYTEEDARRCLERLRPVQFNDPVALPGGAWLTFLRAGHILGAASAILEWEGRRIAFSGDIGRYGDPLMPDPVTPQGADYVVMESTYGDRRHDQRDPEETLRAIITRTIHRGGTVIIPAFAVGRAQSLLYHISRLRQSGRLPALLPIFLDSPMAIDATDIFLQHRNDHRLSPDQLSLQDGDVRYVRTAQDSKDLSANPIPKVIISASGMATGGRVLHHLEHYAPEPKNSVVFAGFQAGGTRGAAMVAGAPTIKMFGRQVPVRAEVHNLSMLSAHADKDELLRWARGFKSSPRQAFIVHGEPPAADALRMALKDELGWNAKVPDHLEQVALD